jgi:hypothetical protein
MRHRTQLYLDEDQYRWLKQRAGRRGSIAAVVRELVDAARSRKQDLSNDPFIRYLTDEPAPASERPSSVETIDEHIYG